MDGFIRSRDGSGGSEWVGVVGAILVMLVVVSGCAVQARGLKAVQGEGSEAREKGEVRGDARESKGAIEEYGPRAVSMVPPTQEEYGRYFYGPLQMRAGEVFEELRADFGECLWRGEARGLEELGVRAWREVVGHPFEVVEVRGAEGMQEVCGEVLARRFVAYVGSGLWDGFDEYGIVVGRRPSEEVGCSEEVRCVGAWQAVEKGETGENGEKEGCGAVLVEAIEGRLRQARPMCLHPRHFEEAMEGDALRSRVLITPRLVVDEAGVRVELFVNHEWALPGAACMVEGLFEEALSSVEGSCRGELRNTSVVYSDVPVFHFVLSASTVAQEEK